MTVKAISESKGMDKNPNQAKKRVVQDTPAEQGTKASLTM